MLGSSEKTGESFRSKTMFSMSEEGIGTKTRQTTGKGRRKVQSIR